jgi:hypothetical protein
VALTARTCEAFTTASGAFSTDCRLSEDIGSALKGGVKVCE